MLHFSIAFYTFAIQIAKDYGAEVTAVDSPCKLEQMKGLGADFVLDYTQQDFTKTAEKYDFILDVRSTRSVFAYNRALAPNGAYVTVGGKTSSILQIACIGPLIAKFTHKKVALLMHKANHQLDALVQLVNVAKVKPVIDSCFPLESTADAFRRFGGGEFVGQVVVTVVADE